MTDKQRLVVVRAGDRSLHENWLTPKNARSYDLIIAYYGTDKNKWRRDDIARIDIQGGKWDGLYQLFTGEPQLLETYNFIWLPDDDIDATPDAVEQMFALHEQYRFELSQPALAPDSYFSHFCLLQNPAFLLRFSNFVEIMMPCLTANLLRRALPLFENNRTGYMLDKIWHLLPDRPSHAAAILDAVAMRHTQKVDYGALDKNRKEQDSKKFSALVSARRKRRPVCYGGILADGRKITGQRAMIWPLLRGWRAVQQQIKHPPKKFHTLLRKQMRYQLTQRADLTTLPQQKINQALFESRQE